MKQEFDGARLEVLWSRLISIAQEQAKTLIRASFTAVVAEMEDLACGIYDLAGNLIVQAPTGTPGILTGMSVGMKHMLRKFPVVALSPGDVLCCNDPWMITGHKFDIAVATPIFRGDHPVAVVATVLHGSDIGGITTAADSNSVYEEGLEIPILKLFRNGERNEDLFEIITANVRTPEQAVGDLMAQVAANAVCGHKLVEFMAEYDLTTLEPLSRAILATTERAAKKAVTELPDGIYHHESWADGIDEPLCVAATVTIRGTDLTVDFEGSSPQTRKGGINSVWNFTFAFTAHAVKSVLVPFLPNNDGLFRSFRMVAPEGTVINPSFPAPVMGRYVMVGPISSAVFGALAKVAPERALAESGRPAMLPLTGIDERGKPFVQWVHSVGGVGARPTLDGYATTCYPGYVKMVPTEILEGRAPVLVCKKEIVMDSGGPGKYRGGCDQITILRFREGAHGYVHCFSEGTKFPPLGYHGGVNGHCAEIAINGRGVIAKSKHALEAGDELAYRCGGGGGYYNPIERDPQSVLDDVINGCVSVASAIEHYKVAIDYNGKTINWEETARLRGTREELCPTKP
ncbi:MAG: hydantoinase B/oxoprolinase family protein [Chloroflexi bacterium]|nr:hydantoinase B/oxoprolinase family protein [Chloroflexota bacterium]